MTTPSVTLRALARRVSEGEESPLSNNGIWLRIKKGEIPRDIYSLGMTNRRINNEKQGKGGEKS